MAEHTPGPWRVVESAVFIGECHTYEPDGSPAWGGFLLRSCPRPEANARRIVACFNACEGIPTDALEQSSELMLTLEAARANSRGWQATVTRLQAENARFKAALEKLAGESNLPWTGTIVQEFARAALGKEST